MADESIEDRFKKAVWLIRNGPKMDSTNEQKLTFYSYFKQVGRHGRSCPSGCDIDAQFGPTDICVISSPLLVFPSQSR